MENLNLLAALPEIVLTCAALLVLLADVLSDRARAAIHGLALVSLLVVLGLCFRQLGTPTEYAFGGMHVSDDLARLLKLCAVIAVGATLIYGRGYLEDRGLYRGEFYALALFSLLGQMVLISASNLLVIYIGLELMTLCMYAVAAMRQGDTAASESAMKYFVLGALASGFLLYGMSMIYGATGSLDLAEIAQAFGSEASRIVLVFGVVFVVAGMAFKFGAVPFHMWVPDVYHGTPTTVTLLIAGAPKLAAFAMAFRLLVEGLPSVAFDWQQMLMVLSVASLVVGNVVAIAQRNLKRMLAYSTIAQIGFVLLGLCSGMVGDSADLVADAYGSAMFYAIAYVLTTLGTFGLIQLLAAKGFEAHEISDLRGLNQRSPWMAFVALILMFSLAGIPPTVGFYAKLVVLGAVINAGHVWLAVLGVLASLIGAFYYLRVVKTMYFDPPADQAPPIAASPGGRAVFAVNGAAVLLLGILPSPLMVACLTAVRQALAS